MLKSLGMAAWPLAALPPGALPRLADLQLSHNPIATIPAGALAACPALRSLELAAVPGAGALAPGALAGAPQLESLDLAQCGCAEVPADVLQLPALRVLVMNGNRLTALPLELTGLSRCAAQRMLCRTCAPASSCQPVIRAADRPHPAAAAAGWRSCTWPTTASATCRRSWA
jgi:hypothetical protein